MPTVLVIAPKLEEREKRSLEAVFGASYFHVVPPKGGGGAETSQWALHAFTQVADEIEEKIEQRGGVCALRNTVAIVELNDSELGELEGLSPMFSVSHSGWTVVTAMLVLAFPELHWVFKTNAAPLDASLFADAHMLTRASFGIASLKKILELNAQGFTPLFDPTGLRNALRSAIKGSQDGVYVPVREEVAASIDEEVDYAYLNAHTAYRFGFRCHVLTHYSLTDRVLGVESMRQNGGGTAAAAAGGNGAEGGKKKGPVSLVFEDLYLNFPDKIPDFRMSRLRLRDTLLPGLLEAERRVFVTVGHKRREKDQETWAENRWYADSLRGSGKHCKTIYKPGSGIFDIWNRAGLDKVLAANRGRGRGYVWPPKETADGEISGSHSAHGRLLVIAGRLIHRGDRVLHAARSVPEALHGALLALEAQEYLGHRTPTTSLEALALKHQSEVLAECMFYGVEYNMDVLSRFKEIDREVDSIGQWFQPGSREMSKLNAEIRIVSEMLKMFREHSQFDEEQKTLKRIRTLHRQLWFHRNRWWAWVAYPVRWYVEFLLGSLLRYVLALTLWLVILTFIYWNFQDPDTWSAKVEDGWVALKDVDLLHGLSDALTAFLGMQPPHDIKDLIAEAGPRGARSIMVVTTTAIVASFLHLGIFISHLYSMIARK